MTFVSKDPAPRRIVLSLLEIAEKKTYELIETREPNPPISAYHPHKLGDEEVPALQSALLRMTFAKDKLRQNPDMEDLSISEICACESVIRLFARESIKTVFDIWARNPSDIRRILEWSKPLGGRHELYLYFFINE
jgi:hypothetical protein